MNQTAKDTLTAMPYGAWPTRADAPVGEMLWAETGKPRRTGFCSGGSESPEHNNGGLCPTLLWHTGKDMWELCGCDCHDWLRDDEGSLRALADSRHEYHVNRREGLTMAKTKSKPAAESAPAEAKPKRPARATTGATKCNCGCDGETRGGRFLPGHDAKLKSRLQGQWRAATTEKAKAKCEAEFHALGWGKYIPS